jgi:hypothetical protein
MLLPRAKGVLEYLLNVISGALKFASLGSSLRSIDTQISKILQEEDKHAKMDSKPNLSSGSSGDVNLRMLRTSQLIIAKMMEECYDNFLINLNYVNVVGERLVVTRLAPYLEDVLLILDYNSYFEKNPLRG